MAITMKQQIVLMQTSEFWKRLQLAGLSVAADVATEEIGVTLMANGEPLTKEEHIKRWSLAQRVITSSESLAKQIAPAAARSMAADLDWPGANFENESLAAAALAESIPDRVYVAALAAYWSFAAGYDAALTAHEAAQEPA